MERDADAMLRLLEDELKLLREQGFDTKEDRERLTGLKHKPQPDLQELEAFWKKLEGPKPPADFPYSEPNSLEEIRAARPQGPPRISVTLTGDELYEKILGGWTGRAAGCMLGKPVEGWKREKIRELLEFCGEYPLSDYFPEVPENERGIGFGEGTGSLLRGNIDRAVRDDDTDYTLLGLKILEGFGKDFKPEDVAQFWLRRLPFACTYTAERVAYKNFVNGVWPPASAIYRNPYREWIGAQIRADAWGYACPGAPEEAAALAFKDACISHTKNGIYGEMWAASMIAAAFACDEPAEAVRAGLSQIPQNCRLAEAIRAVLSWVPTDSSPEETIGRVLERYGDYSPVHTINNAAIVAAALLWGERDFSRTVGIAVMAGLDTDCNGATAGSVLGVMIGVGTIPEKWRSPLNDRLGTRVAGEGTARISELARRTLKMAHTGGPESGFLR